MSAKMAEAQYNPMKKTVDVDGNHIIDLSGVRDDALVTMRSKLVPRHPGVTTTLRIVPGRRPFDFGSFILGPNGLLAALVENHMEIEGLRLCSDVQAAYTHVWGAGRLERLISRYTDVDQAREVEPA